jgi:hypothetical protein
MVDQDLVLRKDGKNPFGTHNQVNGGGSRHVSWTETPTKL